MNIIEIIRPIPVLHLAFTMVVTYLATYYYTKSMFGPSRANYIISCTVTVLVALIGAIISAFVHMLK